MNEVKPEQKPEPIKTINDLPWLWVFFSPYMLLMYFALWGFGDVMHMIFSQWVAFGISVAVLIWIQPKAEAAAIEHYNEYQAKKVGK